jgi:hypothetical protein
MINAGICSFIEKTALKKQHGLCLAFLGASYLRKNGWTSK